MSSCCAAVTHTSVSMLMPLMLRHLFLVLQHLRGHMQVSRRTSGCLTGQVERAVASTVPMLMTVVVVQEKLEGHEAVFWPERRYPWGVSEAFNPQHSDLLHLRLLLLKEACDELSTAKRAR